MRIQTTRRPKKTKTITTTIGSPPPHPPPLEPPPEKLLPPPPPPPPKPELPPPAWARAGPLRSSWKQTLAARIRRGTAPILGAFFSHNHLHVEVPGPARHVEAQPHRQVHLHAPGTGDVPQ